MVQQKTFRFGTRPVAASNEPMSLTDEDAQNLHAYVAKLKETANVLEREVTAIRQGELEAVGALFEEKSSLLKWIELRTPLVEPFLDHELARKLNLKGHLTELKARIEEDGAMLSRISIAARTVLREMEKIRSRNSLGSTYGKSGRRLDSPDGNRVPFDEKI